MLRCDCECLVIVGIYGVLNGLTAHSGRAKMNAFEHTSILVRPQNPLDSRVDDGGAAGYCPRVRCVYYTPFCIAIVRLP